MQLASNKIFFLGTLLAGFFGANVARAVCPVCVVAIVGGLGLSRWLGIDDVVSSIWIGALLVSLILWTLFWLKKKNWDFAYDNVVVSLAYYLLTFVPLYYTGILGHPANQIWGTDKIIFGATIGSIVFFLGDALHHYFKKINNGKSFFPYQKVVVPVLSLIIISLIFYLLLTWKII